MEKFDFCKLYNFFINIFLNVIIINNKDYNYLFITKNF